MPRYSLTVAYDGADFCGWQKQEPQDPAATAGLPHTPPDTRALRQARAEALEPGEPGRIALRTVQAVLERAVREVVREPVTLTGASRTDAGVHAWGQVAAFTCAEGWPGSRGTEPLVRAINARLPEDVLVRAAALAAPDFDPIAHCTSKAYSYTFHISRDRPLWDRRYVCHTRHELDLGAMAAAARALVGEHDFAAFAAAGHGRQSTVRTVYTCDVAELAPAPDGARRVRLEISGNGFLYNMVRIIAGTLHEVGRGRAAPGVIGDIIASRNRRHAGPTMPPDGLRLEWIRYGA